MFEELHGAVPAHDEADAVGEASEAGPPREAGVAADEVGGVGAIDGEAGMATAEYAIATLAAVGLAGLLIVILKGDMVKGLLEGIISTALSVG